MDENTAEEIIMYKKRQKILQIAEWEIQMADDRMSPNSKRNRKKKLDRSFRGRYRRKNNIISENKQKSILFIN
jgi:hypothetical protein